MRLSVQKAIEAFEEMAQEGRDAWKEFFAELMEHECGEECEAWMREWVEEVK